MTFLKRIYAISFQSKFPHHCTALLPAAVQCSVVLSQSILSQTRYHQDQLTKVSVNKIIWILWFGSCSYQGRHELKFEPSIHFRFSFRFPLKVTTRVPWAVTICWVSDRRFYQLAADSPQLLKRWPPQLPWPWTTWTPASRRWSMQWGDPWSSGQLP